MITIAVTNQKGGCGKTTSVRSIGAILNQIYKKKVLLIDLDPSVNLSSFFRQAVESEEDFHPTLLDCMINGVKPEDAVRSFQFCRGPKSAFYTEMICANHAEDVLLPEDVKMDPLRKASVDMVPGDRKFAGMNIEDAEWLKRFLSDPCFGQYDYCLLDCPPQFVSTTVFSVYAADYALIPADTSQDSVEGAMDEWNHVTSAQELGCSISVLGMFFTKVTHVTAARVQMDEVEESLKDTGLLMKTKIRNSEAATLGSRLLGTVPSVYDLLGDYTRDYISLTEEMLTRLKDPVVAAQ